MSNQVELRGGIPDEMADTLEDYFCETESQCWGIMQKEIADPYEPVSYTHLRAHET